MANTTISTASRNAAADGIVGLLDGGTGAGKIEIRDGTQPADPDTAAAGTLLATLVLSDPAFAAATSGTATANAISDDTNAAASGTATWFRAYDGDNTAVIDGDVSATGGGGDLELDDTSIVAGGTVSISSWTVSMPGS